MHGPGRKLTPGESGCESLGDVDRDRREPIVWLALAVNRIVIQRDALCLLATEMLDTFALPANADKVALLGEHFPGILEGWRKRFRENSGDR